MIQYFKDLLMTLRLIEAHLKKIAMCVQTDHHKHGDRASLSTKHWND